MTAALEVDCTQVTVEILAAAGIARVCTELPNNLAGALPVLQVFRTGGPDDSYALDIATMTVHAYAGSQQAANVLLGAARTVIREAVGVVVSGAVLTRARKLGGPSWASYENTAVRHAVSIFQLRFKAA